MEKRSRRLKPGVDPNNLVVDNGDYFFGDYPEKERNTMIRYALRYRHGATGSYMPPHAWGKLAGVDDTGYIYPTEDVQRVWLFENKERAESAKIPWGDIVEIVKVRINISIENCEE